MILSKIPQIVLKSMHSQEMCLFNLSIAKDFVWEKRSIIEYIIWIKKNKEIFLLKTFCRIYNPLLKNFCKLSVHSIGFKDNNY